MMIELKDALQMAVNSARPLAGERIDLGQALNRILAEDVASDVDMPPFDKSLVDGYACRRTDRDGPLSVVETIQAGAVPTRAIGPGQCAKIMTGAPIPAGADCVVMVEHVETTDERTIRCTQQQARDNICRRASDIQAGQRVLAKGVRIGPAHIAALATVGQVRPLVAQRPSVAIVAGGDELVEPGTRPGPSQIRNSNSAQLAAQVEAMGITPRDYGTLKDVGADIDRVLRRALAENDVVIISGGVSVGDFDLVPSALKQNNVELLFEKIAVKPGKPTVFGRAESGWCFGLPGNPVSTFVTFELLVKPFLYALMGHAYAPRCVPMPLAEPIARKDTDRQGWFPVEITDAQTVKPLEYHGSAHILALCKADGLIRMEIGAERIEQGTAVSVRLL